MSPDYQKTWDNMLAIDDLSAISPASAILDIGCRSGILLTWLNALGYRNLWGVDTRAPLPPLRTPLMHGLFWTFAAALTFVARNATHLKRASGERLPFQDGRFAAVTSMSVIEHGVDQQRFLAEVHRVLAPNGALILSTDLSDQHVDRGSRLFGAPDVIFGRDDLKALLRHAQSIGFTVPPVDSLSRPITPVVAFSGQRYTFAYLVFAKTA